MRNVSRPGLLALIAALASLLVVSVASADKGGTNRPFQATLTGVGTFVVPAGCPPDCVDFRTNTAATGQAAHLGRVQVRLSHLPYDIANTLDGTMTLTAANGDKLYGVYDYNGQDTIPITVTRGTGRFTDASGTIFLTAEAIPQFKPMPPCDPATDFFGCLNPDVPWPWSGTMTGAISY